MKLILLSLFPSEVFIVSFVVFEVVMDLGDGLEDVNLLTMMTVTILNGRVRSGDGDGRGPPRLNTEASAQRRSLGCFKRLLGITTGASLE